MLQPEPTNARFVGGPLDGETHVLAHSLPYVQVPGPDETFFARLWAERPDCSDDLLYEVNGDATEGETLVYRSVALGGSGADGSRSPADGTAAPGRGAGDPGTSPSAGTET